MWNELTGRFADWSLRRKLVLITMIIVLAATAAMLAFVQRQAASAREDEFVQRGLAQTRLVAEYAVGPLVFDDNNGARELIAKLLLDPNVAYVRLEDAKGGVFAEVAQKGLTIPALAKSTTVAHAADAATDSGAGSPSSPSSWRLHGDVLHVNAPVSHQGLLGALSVGYRLTALRSADEAERRLLIGVTLGVVLASFLLATLLQRAITTPLLRLSTHARQVAESHELQPLAPPGRDEVGDLYVAFNHLIERVRQREADILALNRSLEAKVIERTRDLAEARDRADQASRSKSEFLANMSHEIRTPINAITGFTALARRTELDERQAGYLETIDTAAHSLLRIVDDLLDFSKIEAGRLDLEKIPFRLADVMNTVVAFVGPLAEKKGLELLLHVGGDVPSHWQGDPLRLGQVLMNLASNAVKFTQQGEVEIRVSRIAAADGDRLRFAVRDTGIGLSTEQAGRLFQAFTQADTSTTRRFGGTGLGLVICQRLVSLMDGRIWLDSEPGVGTTFQFEVKLEPGEETDAGLRGALPDTLRGMPALVVDDNVNARHILVEQLNALGMDARAVASGEAALDELRQATKDGRPYPVVLMDWRMPGVDGIAATRAIRADQSIAGTPVVIMVTAFGREQPLATAEAMNLLDGVLLKPVTPALMLEALRQAMRAQGLASQMEPVHDAPHDHPAVTDAAASAAAQTATAPPARVAMTHAAPRRFARDTAPHMRLPGVRILLVEDHPVNQQLARELLQQEGADVTIAEHGLAALAAIERHGIAAFDVALVDLQMPEMDGIELTKALRARDDGRRLPIIAMTAHAMVEERERCLAAGMNDHLSKPIDPEVVVATLERWIGSETLTKAAARAASAATATAGNRAVQGSADAEDRDHAALFALSCIDAPAALHRVRGNAGLLRALVAEFHRHHANAAAGVSEALARADFESLRTLAHTLKGSAGNVGASGVAAAAAAVETAVRATAGADAERGAARPELERTVATLARELQRLDAELRRTRIATVAPADRATAAATQRSDSCAHRAIPADGMPADAANRAAAQRALRALAQRLTENDTRAEDALAELRDALGGAVPAWLVAATHAIERLDYPAALAAVGPAIEPAPV